MAATGIVTCTTDFGLDDSYVAQLHGALLSAQADLRIVDISHAVPPGDTAAALFLTETAWPHFPPGTVHIVVVDPGVGSDRGLVAIATPPSATPSAWLLGPDTGVLSSGLPESLRPREGRARVTLPVGYAAADIRSTPLATRAVSRTFHGRDLMAPVAAALATGRPLTDAGPPLAEVIATASLATSLPAPLTGAAAEGRILHIDHFGNAITSFRTTEAGAAYTISAGDRDGAEQHIPGPASSYAAGHADGGLVALPSSSGYVEIAAPSGSAAERLGIRRGDRVLIRRRDVAP